MVESLNRVLSGEGMQSTEKHFKTFEDLEVYCVAREFRKVMYAIAGRLPDCEKFGLASQIRRAAVSLTNNIAEGHGRYHYLDQIRFGLQARGSLQELLDDLNVCEDQTYIPAIEIQRLKSHGWRVYQLLNGYMRFLRQKKSGNSVTLHESSPDYVTSMDDCGLGDDDSDSTIQPFNDSTIFRQ